VNTVILILARKDLELLSGSGSVTIESGPIHLDENRVTGRKRTKDEYTDQAAYMPLNKNLIEPLQKYWRFTTETKVGTHHIISLTEEGKHALHFLSADV
jgi:uncharacterized protein DUF6293